MPKKVYLTTPIYYVNSVPHVGHLLTMLCCDVTKRWHLSQGHEVKFLTGTDENGLKVMEAAVAAGEDPMAFVDRISQTFRIAADELGINYDIFFRTTSPEHRKAAQALFQLLMDKGFVYKDTYEGWYDVSAETFVRESDLVDGKSPDGNEVRWISEDNYFFKLSAFGDQLLAHAEAHPEFWLPPARRPEVVSFINQGLRDLCITRTNPGWGIPVPGDDSKVIYVWFDALINYLAATGWPDAGWEELWPADIHWMAKEIFTRFHATLWPAMLMAAGLPLPKTAIAHGWFTFNDSKMSKSVGNVIAHRDLIQWFVDAGCAHDLAIDAARFVLLRSFPYENDSNFSRTEAERNYNADLANDLGNALNRTLSMAHKFVAGVIPDGPVDQEVTDKISAAKAAMERAFAPEIQNLGAALDAALQPARDLNKYVDNQKPWDLAKNADPRLATVIRGMLALVRASEGLISIFMPTTAARMAAQLGLSPTTRFDQIGTDSSLPAGTLLSPPEPMFPRMQPTPQAETTPAEKPAEKAPKPQKPKFEPPAEIGIEDFMKVKLQVARILEAEALEGSEKLVKLQVVIGTEQRQILAGIRKSYNPADLVGRQVIVVANLKPAKLMGHESQGMILAADGPDGSAILLQPEAEAPEGTSVH